ncbi:MAG: SDR family NAD(P)-dependent oxidoreductase [Pseudomonadota bacterium]
MRTAVITGSTGGIGKAVCAKLADDGWSLVLVNRSQSKAEAQRKELHQTYPDLSVELVGTDLMDLVEIDKTCKEISAKIGEIHALYCIAGVLTDQRKLSAQGHESHYAVNVLANYALIRNLLPLMSDAGQAGERMIVTMSSSAINRVKLDRQSLSAPAKIGGLMGAYAQSKLAMTAMCAQMAPDLWSSGVLIRAIDPGPTKTSMTSSGDGMPFFLRWLVPILFSDPDKQAAKIVAATEPSAHANETGILVSSWKKKRLPKSIADPLVRADLLDQIRSDCSAPMN